MGTLSDNKVIELDEEVIGLVFSEIILKINKTEGFILRYNVDTAYEQIVVPILGKNNVGIKESQYIEQSFRELFLKGEDFFREEVDDAFFDYGITCNRCSELALPISNTNRRYRCRGCGCQFVGSYHGY